MARLYGILARDAETGVIFRRGPSRQVLLIFWDLKTHHFTQGQWFKGQIYVRKCDLSPDGTKLVYFAAKHRGKVPTWVAVSSPPYLTAHVLWQGMGTWNDISLFETNDRLALATYRSDSGCDPARGFAIPRRLQVVSKPWPGHFFILANHLQLLRDGWTVSSGDPVFHPNIEPEPVAYQKPLHRGGAVALHLSARNERSVRYTVVGDVDGTIDLKADWADVRGEDVFYARAGKLFRLRFVRRGKKFVSGAAEQLADFDNLTFTAVLPPDWARQW